MKNPANLKKRYESICQDYIDVFCEKQEIQFDGWLGDIVGGTAWFMGQYFLNFNDIAYDVNSNQPAGLILKWQDDFIDSGVETAINYWSYSKGLRYSDL